MEGAVTTYHQQPPALLLSGLVTTAMLVIAWQGNELAALMLAVPVSLALYLLYFSIGGEPLATRLGSWCGESLWRSLVLPLGLVVLLYLYVGIGGDDPLRGNSWWVPLLFCAPVLFYRLAVVQGAAVTWKDVVGVLLCILPYALHDYPFNSNLPYGGGGIESLYLSLAIIVAVYAVVVVRRMPGVGFVPFLSADALHIALKGWAVFFAIAVAIGLPSGFMRWVGYEPVTLGTLVAALALFLRTLFGTALPEELIFRGMIQNLLQKGLAQGVQWRRYLYGSLLLLPLAGVAGYTTEDKAQWFPLLSAALLWGLAWWLVRRQGVLASTYIALLIVSIVFGLAHYHIHSTIFMGLAMVAGWVYGYVYLRTGSVFYAALTHALVNTCPALFGLELVR